MTIPVDIEPATRRLADLVGNVPDELLAAPTPCPDYTLGDLLDHIGGLAVAFREAATKRAAADGPQGPSGDASRLGGDWRDRIPARLAELAEAWRDPGAWTGMTRAGGLDLPGEVAGLVALDEVVIHGWDVARASGQPYEVERPALEAVHGFVSQFAGPGQEEARRGLFGPEVAVPADAPLLDRILGLAGRHPGWSPADAGVGAER
jgi:uncharacterized protein (TIGR03086 family)